jgi:aldose 1-epimerase
MIIIKKSIIGRVDEKDIYLFTLSAENKMTVRLTNYGGIVTSVVVPDKTGKMEDVVLGFDDLAGYQGTHPYFGCVVGRYANRIAAGKFELDGLSYTLARNIGNNHLHGGLEGFDKKAWDAREIREGDEAGIELAYTSADGEEGYPGELKVRVIYSLTPSNALRIRYWAETSRPTPVNLTHHGYFNLKGAGNGNILEHELMIDADRYTFVDDQSIPTGEFRVVNGTPFDFRKIKPVGREMDQVEGGYDHNFVLNSGGKFSKAAFLSEPSSGRWMEVYTDKPGIQLYCGNFLDGTLAGKNGKKYYAHYALCLETQHFPDSPNQPGFPNTILRPGEIFSSETVYRFGAF